MPWKQVVPSPEGEGGDWRVCETYEELQDLVAALIYESLFEDRWRDAFGIERALYLEAARKVILLFRWQAQRWGKKNADDP